MADYNLKIVIAGAGVAGLSAGVYLQQLGYTNILFIEASDRVGGRMKTEHVDGFTLDKGFHTFFTAYPYASELLDYSALDLKYFDSGALVLRNSSILKIKDPYRHPWSVFSMLFSGLGSLGDKLNMLKRRLEIRRMSENQIFEKFEVKTSSILRKKKYSNLLIKNFFNPIFSAIFLDNNLTTSRRVFDYTFKMLIEGRVAIPAKGIEAIPKQLASHFGPQNFMFNKKVVAYEKKKITLDTNESLNADLLIVATEHNSLFAKLNNLPIKNDHRSSTCLYFSATKKPFVSRMVCVNANDPKLVSSVTVLTNIHKGHAPQGKELIAVNLNGFARADDDELESEVKFELTKTFGKSVGTWQLLKVYRIDYAIPNQNFVLGRRQINDMMIGESTYVCGDHLLYGSMNAAIKSSKNLVEIIHKNLNHGHKVKHKKKFDQLFETSHDDEHPTSPMP